MIIFPGRLEDLIAETNTLQTNLSATKHELSDYKQKASRILQVTKSSTLHIESFNNPSCL